jgi:hypothetical protein
MRTRATKGQPLPLPQEFQQFLKKPPLIILPLQFKIITNGSKCDILSHAVERYKDLIPLRIVAGGGWPLRHASNALKFVRPKDSNHG